MISVANKLKLVNELREDKDNTKKCRAQIFRYYTFLAEALEDENKMSIIRANRDTFEFLCDKDMISVIKMIADLPECRDACRGSKQLVGMFTGSRMAVDFNRVAGECGFDTSDEFTLNDFVKAMSSFDMHSTDSEMSEDVDFFDYEEGIEEYTEDEKALRELILADAGLSKSFNNSNKVPDIEFDADKLEDMKASNKDNSVIEEDTNEYEKEQEDIELSNSELDEITDTIQAILNRNEAVFRSCLELDRPYGLLYTKGLARCEIKDGKLKYIAGMGREGKST
mgnify:FL=1